MRSTSDPSPGRSRGRRQGPRDKAQGEAPEDAEVEVAREADQEHEPEEVRRVRGLSGAEEEEVLSATRCSHATSKQNRSVEASRTSRNAPATQ